MDILYFRPAGMDLLKAEINLLKPLINLPPNLCFTLDHFILWNNDRPNIIDLRRHPPHPKEGLLLIILRHDRDFWRPTYLSFWILNTQQRWWRVHCVFFICLVVLYLCIIWVLIGTVCVSFEFMLLSSTRWAQNGFKSAHREHKNSWTQASNNFLDLGNCGKVVQLT